MANFKILIRPKEVDKSGDLKIKVRVTHAGKTRYICTGIKIKPWQFSGNEIVDHTDARINNIKLRNTLNQYNQKVNEMGAPRLKNTSMATLLHILRNLEGSANQNNIIDYIGTHAARLKEEGRTSYAETFERTEKLLQDYSHSDILFFSDITPFMLHDLARKMKLSGNSVTTIAIYMRNIRTIFNNAISNPAAPVNANHYPFRAFKIPTATTRKKNLQTARTIIKLSAHVIFNLYGLPFSQRCDTVSME